MTLWIRPATPEDLPAMLDIYNESVVNSTATFDLQPQTLEERAAWFEQFNSRYPLLVAVHEGIVAGYCGLTRFRSKAAYDRTAELSIYLHKSKRGAGIGARLMEEIIRLAALNGFHVLIGAITGGNEPSVRLHRRFGFTEAGVLREVGIKFDCWQDVHLYQLLLSESSGA